MLTSLIESVAKDPKYHSPAVRTLCQQLLDLLGTGIKYVSISYFIVSVVVNWLHIHSSLSSLLASP